MFKWSVTLALVAALGAAACSGHRTPTNPTPPVGDGGDGGGGQQPPPPPPVQPPTLAITRLLAFGDSLTEGVTSPVMTILSVAPPPVDAGRSVSYPFKLQQLETALYTTQTITVLNGGLAGQKAADDRDRLAADVKGTSPQVVLLMEGANDLNAAIETPNTTISAAVNAMEDMVRDTLLRGVPVLLATLPPQRPNSPKGSAAALVPRYNDALKVMAAKKGATIVDVGARVPLDLIGADGLHPTEAGYDLIATIFQDAIAAKWQQAPAPVR